MMKTQTLTVPIELFHLEYLSWGALVSRLQHPIYRLQANHKLSLGRSGDRNTSPKNKTTPQSTSINGTLNTNFEQITPKKFS